MGRLITLSKVCLYRLPFLRIILILLTTNLYAQDEIKIYDEQVGEYILVYAANPNLSPYSLKLQIDQKGLRLQKPLPEFIVVPGNEKRFLMATLRKEKDVSWRIKYQCQYMVGDANAIHNEDYVYQLPFKKGRVPMSQGYNSPSTHKGINALDFTMPEGQVIVAARNGVVVQIKENSNKGCPSRECMSDGNYVRILHDDGTIAEYHHLQFNGALVAPGDVVAQGQEIGKCGATGFATGPHLHFIVFKTDGTNQITIKTKFKYSPNKIGYLKEGQMYTAF